MLKHANNKKEMSDKSQETTLNMQKLTRNYNKDATSTQLYQHSPSPLPPTRRTHLTPPHRHSPHPLPLPIRRTLIEQHMHHTLCPPVPTPNPSFAPCLLRSVSSPVQSPNQSFRGHHHHPRHYHSFAAPATSQPQAALPQAASRFFRNTYNAGLSSFACQSEKVIILGMGVETGAGAGAGAVWRRGSGMAGRGLGGVGCSTDEEGEATRELGTGDAVAGGCDGVGGAYWKAVPRTGRSFWRRHCWTREWMAKARGDTGGEEDSGNNDEEDSENNDEGKEEEDDVDILHRRTAALSTFLLC